MRTDTHFCTGEGSQGFRRLLPGYFPGGKLTVICENREKGAELISALPNNYRANLLTVGEAAVATKCEEIRFVIGMGGTKVIRAVERYFDGVKFCFFAEKIDYRYLLRRGKDNLLPEFVYLDVQKNPPLSAKMAYDAYASLLALWAEAKVALFSESYLPFVDKGLTAVCVSAEKVLDGQCDRDEFLRESLRLIESFCKRLLDRYAPFFTAGVAEKLSDDGFSQAVAAFFGLRLLANFTKFPIRDILIPSTDAKTDGFSYDEKVLPEHEKLRLYARKLRAMDKKTVPPCEKILLAFDEGAADVPPFATMKEKGILEGLLYEGFTRD